MLRLHPSEQKRARGSSLVEVLIAMFLVAISMLGLMSMLLNTMARQKDTADRRVAAMLATEMAERIAANKAGFEGRKYDGLSATASSAAPTRPNCAASICTSAEVAGIDWADLVTAVRARLAGGAAWVDTETDGRWARITVGWTDPRRQQDFEGVAQDIPVDPRCETRGITDKSYRCYELRTVP